MAAALPVVGNIVSGLIGAGVQARSNSKLWEKVAGYNTPKAQMARYAEAGLNPNLVYTQGSSGNMTPITPTNWQGAVSGAGSQFVQSELQQSQMDVNEQKVAESQQKVQVQKAQEALLKQNPYMRDEYLNDVIDIMDQTAKQKRHDVGYWMSDASEGADTVGKQKVFLDIQNLVQRNNLATADNEIKAQILKSEQFKQELLEVQRNWMKAKEITPQHIWQGLMLLFTSMLR